MSFEAGSEEANAYWRNFFKDNPWTPLPKQSPEEYRFLSRAAPGLFRAKTPDEYKKRSRTYKRLISGYGRRRF